MHIEIGFAKAVAINLSQCGGSVGAGGRRSGKVVYGGGGEIESSFLNNDPSSGCHSMRAMQSPRTQVEVDAVNCTAQLSHRPARQPDYEAEHRAVVSLAQALADPPRDILQRLTEAAIALCEAGSAGISIIEDDFGEKVFRWHALTGALAPHKWGTTPRDFSPCGVVIDRNATQLMHLPERRYPYLTNVKPQVVEVLLVPFSVRGQPVGTIWVATHDKNRQFDSEDARLVEELGHMASKAYQLASSVAASQSSDRRKDEFVAELAHELRRPLNTKPHSQDAHLLQSMKRMINDSLDRSRSSRDTGADSATRLLQVSGALVDRQRPARGAAGTVRLPRGPVRDRTNSGVTGAPHGKMASASDAVSLVRRMRSGEQRALEQLYNCTVDTVYALARAILGSEEDAEEVVCDTYAQA